jgi:hypothetical protein
MFLALKSLGDLKCRMDNLENTFHWGGTYLAFARRTKDLGNTYQSLLCLGDIILAMGDDESAHSIFCAVLQGSTEMDVHGRRADCFSRIGDILMRRGDLNGAMMNWKSARTLFRVSSQGRDLAEIDQRILASTAAENSVER